MKNIKREKEMARNFIAADNDSFDTASFAFTDNRVTAMLWQRWGSGSSNTPVWNHWPSWGLFSNFATDQKPEALIRDGASNKAAKLGTSHNTDLFNCVVIRANGTNVLITSNLDTTVTGDSITNIDDTTADSRVNGYNSGGSDTDMEAAHAVTWNVSLSENEVTALTRGVNPLPIRHSNKVNWIPLDGNNDPENEYSQNQRAITTNGSPVRFTGNPPVELIENYL